MATEPQPARTMFHYLLELHRDGASLLKLELNVPVKAFPAVRMSLLLSLESMLVEYGKAQELQEPRMEP